MIKFENGLVNISGKGIDILSEYAVITHEIKEMFVKDGGKEEEVKEQLRHSFEHGLMSEEELDKEIEEMAKAYKMEADQLKKYLGDAEAEQMKTDLAVQKAVDLLVAEAKEA